MTFNNSKCLYQKLGQRMSEEFQLLAEEKWIIEALTKIKNQRNCLQIERLNLESLKVKLKNPNKNVPESTTEHKEAIPSTSAVNLMQLNAKKNAAKNANEQSETIAELFEDVSCNNDEELNLVVTNPVFNTRAHFNEMEEDDEDDEDDDDMFVDIGMFMNGVCK